MSHYCLRLLFDEVRLPDFTYLSLFLCISIYQLYTDTHTRAHGRLLVFLQTHTHMDMVDF